MTSRSSHLLQHQQEEERQDSIESEITSELDDALNELGMLSSSSGAAIGADPLTGLSRKKDFLKDKWRRGRYPLRREKEREICWSSSSSSGSCCSSSGSSSRRSSSSSAGSGSFSSMRSCYTRSPLLSSYSIAETPTSGYSPGISSFASSSAQSSVSTSSFGSGSDMRMNDVVNMCMRSVDVVKVLRHRPHRPSPYNRRCSLNLIGKVDRPSSSSSSGFYSPPVGSDSLILRSGLSDSEASSGSGTGTPPPPLRPNSFNAAFFKTFSENMAVTSVETKSNPCSPEKNYDMKLAAENTLQMGSRMKVNNNNATHSAYTCSSYAGCAYASMSHVHCSSGILSRSKSLDDLTSAAFVSEDSSSSTDFGHGHPPDGCFLTTAAPHHLQQPPLTTAIPESAFLRCCHAPIHHHSHHQLQSQADPLTQPVSVLRPSDSLTPVPSCDSSLYDNVVHRMNQLEMN